MNPINLFPALRISSSGLEAERIRMETIANNLANVNSTRGKDGKVYRRHLVAFKEKLNREIGKTDTLQGVKVDKIFKDMSPLIIEDAPLGHPHATKDGKLKKPNVAPIVEMMDMIIATRAYEANLTAMKQSRDMADKTIHMAKA